jgi:hypothetical protein
MCDCCMFFRRTSPEHAFLAVKKGDLKTLTRILTKNDNYIYSKNENMQTLLHAAAANNNFKIAKYLIKAGIFLDTQDKDKNTALHLAVKAESLTIIDLLLKKGINISLQNNSGETAFKIALHENKPIIQELLNDFNEKKKKKYALLRYGTTNVNDKTKSFLDQQFKKILEGGEVDTNSVAVAPPMSATTTTEGIGSMQIEEGFWESAIIAFKAFTKNSETFVKHPLKQCLIAHASNNLLPTSSTESKKNN